MKEIARVTERKTVNVPEAKRMQPQPREVRQTSIGLLRELN
jgi:hypothetical protein